MKLLTELTHNVECLTESSESGVKSYYLQGVFMQEDTKNKNGRIYPASVLDPVLQAYNESHIAGSHAFGELNHPTEPTINMDKVSHYITELVKDGKNWIGKAKIMETPMGKIVKVFMDENQRPGVSSRGLGSLKETNGNKIVEALILTTAADIVADPSVSDAHPKSIIESALLENYEWILEGETWVKKEAIIKIVEEHKSYTREQREAAFLNMFNKYVNTLKD